MFFDDDYMFVQAKIDNDEVYFRHVIGKQKEIMFDKLTEELAIIESGKTIFTGFLPEDGFNRERIMSDYIKMQMEAVKEMRGLN